MNQHPAVITFMRWPGSLGQRLPIELYFDGVKVGSIPAKHVAASFLVPPEKFYSLGVSMDGYGSRLLRIYPKVRRNIVVSAYPPKTAWDRQVAESDIQNYFCISLDKEHEISYSDMIKILRTASSYDGSIVQIR